MLTISEVADRLEVAESSVRLWCRTTGIFPGARHYGRAWLIPEQDLKHFVRRPVGRPPKKVRKLRRVA